MEVVSARIVHGIGCSRSMITVKGKYSCRLRENMQKKSFSYDHLTLSDYTGLSRRTYTCRLCCSRCGLRLTNPTVPSTLQFLQTPISGWNALFTPREPTVFTSSVFDPFKTRKRKIACPDDLQVSIRRWHAILTAPISKPWLNPRPFGSTLLSML